MSSNVSKLLNLIAWRKCYQIIIPIFLSLFSSSIMALTLISSAFQNGTAIPTQYTCVGSNSIPPLSWRDIPSNAKSLVLIISDPDAPAGVWDHWLVFNIPVNSDGIKDDAKELPQGSVVLKNSWGNTQYDGPCPPRGTHHYWFYLYALNTTLSLSMDASKAQLQAAMKNKIVAQASVMGTFSK